MNRLNTTSRLVLPETDELDHYALMATKGNYRPGQRQNHDGRLELIREAANRIRELQRRR